MLLKMSLLFQSIFPLILIVFGINTYNLVCDFYDKSIDINIYHYCLIVFLAVLLILIVLTIISFLLTKNFKCYGEELPETIEKVAGNNEIGLEFFMTYIVSLIMSDLTNIGKIIAFIVVLIIMIILIYKTDLYFINPILIVLGYNFYNIETQIGGKYKCMSRNIIKVGDKIIFKKVSENLIYGRKFVK